MIAQTFFILGRIPNPYKIAPIARIVINLAAEFNSGRAVPPLLHGNPFIRHIFEYLLRLSPAPVWDI